MSGKKYLVAEFYGLCLQEDPCVFDTFEEAEKHFEEITGVAHSDFLNGEELGEDEDQTAVFEIGADAKWVIVEVYLGCSQSARGFQTEEEAEADFIERTGHPYDDFYAEGGAKDDDFDQTKIFKIA